LKGGKGGTFVVGPSGTYPSYATGYTYYQLINPLLQMRLRSTKAILTSLKNYCS